MSDNKKTKSNYCNSCMRHTEHTVDHTLKYSDGEEINPHDDEYNFWVGYYYWYELLQCNGCKEVSLSGGRFFSEWDREHDVPEVFRYPAEKRLQQPEWCENLPNNILKVLNEVYTAIQYKCFMLASTGIRTVLDLVFIEKVGDLPSFKEKVDAMIEEGLLAKLQKETVMAVIDAGNASAHRGFNPDIELLTKAVRITESLLETVYIHPDDRENLRQATPPRSAKK